MMQPFPPAAPHRIMLFRVGEDPAAGRPLPLRVRSVGHYQLPGNHPEHRPPGGFAELFWTVRGHGHFRLKNKTYDAGPEDVFWHRPAEAHQLQAGPAGWDYRWVTFDGPDVMAVLRPFGLPRHHRAGPCPAHTFTLLETLLRQPTATAAREASVAAYALLEVAGRYPRARPRPAERLADDARRELDHRFTDPAFGVDAMARHLGVHRTTLQRSFTAVHGLPPSAYLARRRVQHALTLLRTTATPVVDVAVAAGFRSPEYLARVVRAETGLSPRAFRRDDSPCHRPA